MQKTPLWGVGVGGCLCARACVRAVCVCVCVCVVCLCACVRACVRGQADAHGMQGGGGKKQATTR